MAKRTLRELPNDDLRGRTVLVRVDFNVPVDESGRVEDDTRIRRSLATLRHLAEAGARTLVLSHLGRPAGERDPSLCLEAVAARVGELLEAPVSFVGSPAGEEVRERAAALDEGDVLVLENTRFHPGERANDADLARSWAELGDLYVQEAFGSAHRAHASTTGLPEAIRERGGLAVTGLLTEEELQFVDRRLRNPEPPFVAVLGGAKISGKIDVVDDLLSRVDRLLIGGAMANTFFRALGLETGTSLVEEDRIEMARSLLERAGDRLLLPVDCVVADEIVEGASTRISSRSEVGGDESIGDIGPATRDLFREEIVDARSVVWNGPLGIFEVEAFGEGTLAVARAVAEASKRGALTVIGGGDSASAVEKAGLAEQVSHVSTGGGAFLDLLSGAGLPGIEVLSEAS